MRGTVNVPVLEDFASAGVGMGRTGCSHGLQVFARAARFFVCSSYRWLVQELDRHCLDAPWVAVTVKNNCWDSRPFAGNACSTRGALPHGGKSRGHVSGGSRKSGDAP